MSSAPNRSPAGLYLPLHVGIRGRTRYQTLDERGVPEIPRNASGFAIGPLEGVEHPNLITNLGLNAVASQEILQAAGFRNYLAVGTGSTAPNVADTTLVAEVQRAAASGGFTAFANSFSVDGVANTFNGSMVVNRTVTMTADRNLTEYGLSAAASVNIAIRELFRDSLGDPVTISLLTDKILRLEHTLSLEMDAPAAGFTTTIDLDEYDAANVLIASTPYNVTHGPTAYANTTASILAMFAMWAPNTRQPVFLGTTATQGFRRIVSAQSYARINAWALSVLDPASQTGQIAAINFTEGYVTDTFQRIKRGISTATAGAGDWHGILFGHVRSGAATDYARSGHMVLFDSPASYTKADTDTIQAGIITTWARAAEGS